MTPKSYPEDDRFSLPMHFGVLRILLLTSRLSSDYIVLCPVLISGDRQYNCRYKDREDCMPESGPPHAVPLPADLRSWHR